MTVVYADENHWLRSGQLATWWWEFCNKFPWLPLSRYAKIASIAGLAYGVLFLAIVTVHRLVLRALLAWRGWVYAPRGEFLVLPCGTISI